MGGPKEPALEIRLGLVGRLLVELLEIQAQVVGSGGFQIELGKGQRLELFRLVSFEVFLVLEPDVAG